jgi:hypothetical protein
VVSAWTTGGNLADAVVKLQATPSSVAPKFSFGCGSDDGTASCDLGAIDATSAQRQLQAESTVATTASSVTSVKLTVTGTAANLTANPAASATVQISGTVTPTSSPSPSAAASTPEFPTPTPSTSPITTTSPLPVGNLPGITSVSTPSSTLSPGGNAGNLFPTLDPSSGSSAPNSVKGRPVADTTALPEGASVLGASLIGLLALALAFVLAVTRFSIRRRPTPSAPGATAAPGDPKAQDPPPATSAAPTAAAAGAAGTLAPSSGDKAPSGAPDPAKDAPEAANDAPEAPKAPEDPADPPADTTPGADA